jgi:spermidine synthase
MYYHFAFVAISVAMFGMAAGALAVYLRPDVFTAARLGRHLALGTLGFAITTVVSFLTHVWMPFRPELSVAGVLSVIFTYFVLCVPFTFSGIVVALVLTRFPRQVGALYAADLAGAAVGCALLGPLLRVTDAPTGVMAAAALAAVAALLFAKEVGGRSLMAASAGAAVVLAGFTALHTIAVQREAPWLRLVWVKGRYEPAPLVERWNEFSRVRVIGDPSREVKPSGWGMSRTLPPDLRTRELHMDIDSYAGTELTAFEGDTTKLQHLEYDVTNVAHYLRPSSRVLVVGTGGGRDILSALAFGQRQVTGIEINDNILYFLNRRFGDFTGHLDRDPRVTFVNDEARSYIARMNDRVDIIQISLIDTWAATASGAFVLTENSLYTVEAWHSFLQDLAPRGILTVSRWYFADRPGEIYRIAALASTTLMEMGVARPGHHYAIVRARPAADPDAPDGVGTLLVSRDPLSAQDLDTLEAVAARLKFDVVYSPRHTADAIFAAIADRERLQAAVAAHPLDISAPTDDSPFFFHMLRLRDVFDVSRWRDQGIVAFNLKAVGLLGVLLVTVFTLTLLCIIVPLLRTRRTVDLTGAAPHLLFFGVIGLGFMLVEISQMQRLTIFLGHPVYALSVVLFSLLLSSGAGSLATSRAPDTIAAATSRIALTVGVLVTFGAVTPAVAQHFEAASNATRILASIGLLLPIGFCMGMAFPLGMRIALRRSPQLAPWLWGINGAASVCASVLAVVIAIGAGISAAFWTGTACYAVALAAVAWQARAKVQGTPRRRSGEAPAVSA